MTDRLVPTGTAAKAAGVARSTLWRWIAKGDLTPHATTAGGHLRWNVERLRREIDTLRRRNREDRPMPQQSAGDPESQPVAAAIVTSHLGVLAGRRNDKVPPWTFIAGEIEPGESAADAAIREVKEETGLLVVSGHSPIGRRVHPHTGRTMVYLACLPVEGTDVFVGDEVELAEVQWLSLRQVDELLPGMFEPVREHLGRLIS